MQSAVSYASAKDSDDVCVAGNANDAADKDGCSYFAHNRCPPINKWTRIDNSTGPPPDALKLSIRDLINNGIKLKNLLILIVICLGVWQFFFKDSAMVESFEQPAVTAFSNSPALQTIAKAKEIAKPKAVYRCDGRQHCSQMSSYEEAKYFLQHCPNTKINVDYDGIPCERQFNK